jgi:hypothetical protein
VVFITFREFELEGRQRVALFALKDTNTTEND